MRNLVPVRRALLSVSDKSDVVAFAKALVDCGVQLISTGGTARTLTDAGLNVIGIEQVTGFPEIMDGRVKTLHPAVHGALLARRDDAGHQEALRTHDITPIDLVCINLYPFEQTILQEQVDPREAIEQIDIGGPAMLRSAAKNHAFVTAVTSPDQYDRVINEMRAQDGATSIDLRRELAAAAFTRTAEYDTAISAWMCARREDPFPSMLRLTYARQSILRYGENPHQKAAVYADPTSSAPNVVTAPVLHGKPLSYNNVHDAAAALQVVGDLHQSFPDHAGAAIIKHANPCGAAIASSAPEAFARAYECNPLAAFGGILAVNRDIDEAVAGEITAGKKFLEVIVAPSFSESAAASLGERWKKVRLLAVGRLGPRAREEVEYRSIVGGMLVQDRDRWDVAPSDWRHVAGPPPDQPTLETARFLWTIVAHLKSNAVAIARDGQLLGAGMGQVDRLSACQHAVVRAGDRLTGDAPVVAASDAFFPFPDGPAVLIDAGVRCIVQPGGSMRDQETIDLCAERDVTCLLTGVRHFRH